MDLVFCAEGRFVRRSDNSVYSLNGNLTNHLWSRYLNAFDRIYVMARVLFDDSIEAVSYTHLTLPTKLEV